MKKLKTLSFILVFAIVILTPLVLTNNAVPAATSTSSAGRVTTVSGHLNVRASASTSAAILTVLAKNSYVTLISKTGSWWYVEYAGGKYGYCSDQYIYQIAESFPAYVSTSYSNLNIRDGAGTNYEIIGKLSKGANVVVLEKAGSWYWILYDGTNLGYVSAAYIKTHSKQTYPVLNLTAANYKQTDSRWANVTLGSSGKKMSGIGCLTCCVAIIETYKKGYTILPNTLSYSMSYTPDGSLYWPSYFSFYSSSGYLSVLYNNLKAGKPVIIGMRTSAGRQHWAVVTAYTGGNTLTAANFKISDPGSNSRTTLQHLINEYPIFNRIAYY